MTQDPRASARKRVDDPEEDTIEMALSTNEMLLLSKSADAKKAAPPTFSKEPTSVFAGARWPLVGVTVAFGVAAAVIAFVSAAHRAPDAVPPPPPVVPQIAVVAPPEPAQPVEEAPQAVLFKNPFDRNEVFEFPAGTSDTDARARVATILMERARDRKPLPVHHPKKH